jgi:glycosyltransferase involved in cell wall biosynthesis
MHILLIHQAFAALDEAGGTRHYEIARFLAGNGHKVTIITSPVSYLTGKSGDSRIRWVEKETPEKGITILRAYAYPALHRSFFHRILSFFSFMFSSFFIGLGVKNVDAVWGTSPPIFQGWTAWLLARLKRVPFLFEIRDLWPEFAIAIGVLKNRVIIRMSYWLESFLYKHADQLVVNSPGFIPHVEMHGGKNILLIPNGADPEMFDPEATGSEFRKANNLEKSFVVLYAGAHGISNDLEVVLSAALKTAHYPEIKYVFVGDGKEKANLIQKAHKAGLTNVVFLPPVPKNQMADVIAGANACIAILKPLDMYKTTYPNKIFDYLAAGRPIIQVIDGVSREIVETAKAGIFVPPGNAEALAAAVVDLALDRTKAKTMGMNGRAYVIAHFDRRQLARQFETTFNLMIDNC